MSPPSPAATPSAPARRRYDSPLRRQQLASTRERIVAAGSSIVHRLPTWEWKELTFRAVAERAGVSERTVYRHFPTERELHDAVMSRLEEEAGVTYEDISLDEVAAVATKVFEARSAFAVTPFTVESPTFLDEDHRRQSALLEAVTAATPDWSERDRRLVAALLDVLWNTSSYERLVVGWQIDGAESTEAIEWAIGLVIGALRNGQRPPRGRGAPDVLSAIGNGRSARRSPGRRPPRAT
jgi:AcrR family transcriptional regulator